MRDRDVVLELGSSRSSQESGTSTPSSSSTLRVGAETQSTDVDAGPDAVRVLLAVGDDGRVGGDVGLDQAFRVGRDLAVGGSAPPDVELGRLGAGPQAASDSPEDMRT